MAAWLLLSGAALLHTSLATIRTFAWPQPTYDQFRLYPIYLEQPFPQSVLQLENQHRPVFPGLVRVAEIEWRDADQQWQIAFGVVCALLTALAIALASLRERGLALTARAAGASAAVIAVFWLGNARMLLHGNELVHAYLVTLAVVGGAYGAWRAGRDAPWRWLAFASGAAVVATFSFGPGIALFPALLIVAWLQRVPLRTLLLPIGVCVACLILYVWVLPGDQGVRGVLELRPWESFSTAARWIASPWVHAWLGFADPPLNSMHAELLSKGPHTWLLRSANALQSASGLKWDQGLAMMVGLAGIGIFGVALLRASRRREELRLIEAMSLALMMFGAASAAIIGIGRLDYLQQHPGQVFADRYLVWPCLFWLGVALHLLASSATHGVWRNVSVAFVALLPVALWATHELGAEWGSAVYRNNQASAAAARTDVLDREVFWPEDPSVILSDKLHSLELFRERKLAMFAGGDMRLLGQRWDRPVVASNDVLAELTVPARVAHDLRDERSAARFSVEVRSGISRIPSDSALLILDASNQIVGYAERTFVADRRPALRWSVPRKRGIDGFIRDYDAAEHYRLVMIEAEAGRAVELVSLSR